MNRKEFENAVRVQGKTLNTYAAAVLKSYVSTWDYKQEDVETYPSMQWVADDTHMNKDTVKDYVTALVEDGWMIPANKHGRTQGYFLAIGVVNHPQLAKPKKKNTFTVSPDAPETKYQVDTKEEGEGLRMEPTPISGWTGDVSPDGTEVSPDGPELITKNNHIEEPLEEPTTGTSPVEIQSSPSPSINEDADRKGGYGMGTIPSFERDEEMNKEFKSHWYRLDAKEKKFFADADGTPEQIAQAVIYYRTVTFPFTSTWMDIALEAQKKAGIEVDEW